MLRRTVAVLAAFLMLIISCGIAEESGAVVSGKREADYLRAFSEDYADIRWSEEDPDRQVSSGEFREMLLRLVKQLAPDREEWFRSKVTDFEVPLSAARQSPWHGTLLRVWVRMTTPVRSRIQA